MSHCRAYIWKRARRALRTNEEKIFRKSNLSSTLKKRDVVVARDSPSCNQRSKTYDKAYPPPIFLLKQHSKFRSSIEFKHRMICMCTVPTSGGRRCDSTRPHKDRGASTVSCFSEVSISHIGRPSRLIMMAFVYAAVATGYM